MSRVDAPAPEPMDNTPKKAPVRSRGKYIDFVPRTKKRPAASRTPKPAVVQITTETVVEEPILTLDTEPEVIETQLEVLPETEPEEELAVLETTPEPELEEPETEEKPEAEEELEIEEPEAEEESEAQPVLEPEYETQPETEPEIIIDDPTNLTDLDRELLEFEDALKDFAEEPSDDPEGDLENAIIEEEQTDFVAEVDADDYVATISGVTTKTTIKDPPFLKDYHIEKRPLSNHAPETLPPLRPEAIEPTVHEEFNEEKFEESLDKAPEPAPVVTSTEKSGSKIGMFLTVLITVLLGAGVGVFVYLAFFQSH